MADDFVSLNEITSVKGDADLAYGTQGVGGTDAVLPFSKGIELLSRAAELKQQNDRWKYEQFQNNLKESYKTFNELDVNGVMEKDYPEIMQEYSSLAKTMAENIGTIRNPASNPEMYAMLKQKEADLRGKIAQSKGDVKYRGYVKDLLDKNPEWNVGANKENYEKFTNSGLGQREYNLPQPPEVYDISKHATLANSFARRQMEKMTRSDKGAYIDDKGSDWTDEQLYEKAFDALGANTDASGRTWKDLALTSLRKAKMIPDGMSDDDAYLDVGKKLIMGEKYYNKIGFDQVEVNNAEIASREKIAKGQLGAEYAKIAAMQKQQRGDILLQSGYKMNPKGEWELPVTNSGREINVFDGIDLSGQNESSYEINGSGSKVLKDGEYEIGSDKLNVGTTSLAGGFNPTFDGKIGFSKLDVSSGKVKVVVKGGVVQRVVPLQKSKDNSYVPMGAGTTRDEMYDIQRGVNDVFTGGKSERTAFERKGFVFDVFNK